MQKVCDVLDTLTNAGVVGKYAIGGATAAGFRLPQAGPKGFAAWESANPILIVDEVLAVGFRLGERYSSQTRNSKKNA